MWGSGEMSGSVVAVTANHEWKLLWGKNQGKRFREAPTGLITLSSVFAGKLWENDSVFHLRARQLDVGRKVERAWLPDCA